MEMPKISGEDKLIKGCIFHDFFDGGMIKATCN